jgi:hypothetical protein
MNQYSIEMESLFAMSDPSSASSLGVPGYAFSDLHEPERLASLYERLCEGVAAADPALWREWDAYRAAPDAPRPPATPGVSLPPDESVPCMAYCSFMTVR